MCEESGILYIPSGYDRLSSHDKSPFFLLFAFVLVAFLRIQNAQGMRRTPRILRVEKVGSVFSSLESGGSTHLLAVRSSLLIAPVKRRGVLVATCYNHC